MRRLALAVCCVLALRCGALGASALAPAEAAPYLPPPDKVFWGGQGGYSAANIADFTRQSGLHPAVYNYFISWRATRGAMHWLSFRLADSTRMAHGPCCRCPPPARDSRPPRWPTGPVTVSSSSSAGYWRNRVR